MSKLAKTLAAPTAWAELHQAVHRFVAKRVRDAHAAEDIAQDVMLKVQAQLPTLASRERLTPWVFRIARNAIVDHYRSRRDIVPLDDADSVLTVDSPDAMGELSACVEQMIRHLPEPARTALQLADVQGLKQQELADRLGISLSGAKSRVQRAREQFHAMLLDCCTIEQNARGQVVDYQTTDRTARYCGGDGSGTCK
jgi:RNA polymerase sigma-70 factor (ECF subfamily)